MIYRWIFLLFLIVNFHFVYGAIAIEQVATDLENPVAISNAGDGSMRLFIVLQGGQIMVYSKTNIRSTPFLDVSSKITSGGEQGLLGLTFHPNYESNGYFYVNYTNKNGDTRIVRYQVSSTDKNIADPSTKKTILKIDQPFDNHNGGQIEFGPDGYLYIGMGDGGSGGDPDNHAQDLGDLLGKMLRIDVDGGDPYAIPADNPFINTSGARDEIWAYGLRNPWRFSFDKDLGDLFIADVGQSDREEVNFQASSSSGGENYGWRLMEGTQCYNPSIGCNDNSLTLPVFDYNNGNEGNCSVTGGYRYRGAQAFAEIDSLYVYADFCRGVIIGATPNSPFWSTAELLNTGFLVSSFGQDEVGELYVAQYSDDGAIYRIVDPNGPPGVALVKKRKGENFGIKIYGSNLQNGIQAFIAGQTTAWPDVEHEHNGKIEIHGGEELFPKDNTYTLIRLVNPNSQEIAVMYNRTTKDWIKVV